MDAINPRSGRSHHFASHRLFHSPLIFYTMKQLASTYSISGAAVTLTGVNVPLSQILLIANATTGSVLYSMAGPTASSYTQATNSVITLASAPAASDKLTIYYDDGVASSNAPASVSVSDFPSGAATAANQATEITSLATIAGVAKGSGAVDSNTQRVTLASDGPGVSNLTTIATNTTGAATASNQTSGSQKTLVVNGANTLAVDSAGAVTINNSASAAYSFSQVGGTIAAGTALIGPVTCSSLREFSVQITSLHTSSAIYFEISNDNATWAGTLAINQLGQIFTQTTTTTGVYNIPTCGALYFRVRGNVAVSTGTTTITAYGLQQSTPKWSTLSTVNSVTTVVSTTAIPTPSNGGGFKLFHNNNSAATINATNVKTSGGTIGTLLLTNTTASFKYLLLVNKASAPVSGTDSPLLAIPIPPNTTIDGATAFAGINFNLGISYYISASNTFTGTSTTSTPTAVAAGDVNVALSYV